MRMNASKKKKNKQKPNKAAYEIVMYYFKICTVLQNQEL